MLDQQRETLAHHTATSCRRIPKKLFNYVMKIKDNVRHDILQATSHGIITQEYIECILKDV